jgi:hypothetical protein
MTGVVFSFQFLVFSRRALPFRKTLRGSCKKPLVFSEDWDAETGVVFGFQAEN